MRHLLFCATMQSIYQQFLQRKASPLIQFIKYAICGGMAVVTNMLVFYLLAWLVLPALGPDDPFVRITGISAMELSDTVRAWRAGVDLSIAFIASNFVAYLLNILWVFEPGRHNRILEIAMFYAASGISFVLGLGLQTLLIKCWSASTSCAFIAQLVTAAMLNFVARKFLIFKG